MNALLADIIKSDFGFSRPFLSHGHGLSGERPKNRSEEGSDNSDWTFGTTQAMNVLRAGTIPPAIKEVNMARKSVRKSAKKATSPQKSGQQQPRARVITFRISDAEVTLIQKAADRVPLARYSRDAVLARATADAKK